MLPKPRRLTSKEVTEVLKCGRSRRAVFLSIKLVNTPTPLKTSVVVAKSVAKKAVERNRLRRAVYRALAPLSGTGSAVIFVQKMPQNPLSASFTQDLKQFFTNH